MLLAAPLVLACFTTSLLAGPAAPTATPARAPVPKAPASKAPVPKAAGARASAGTPAVATVLARMQERYDRANDYRAKFTQKYTNAATGRERTSTGELFIKKPGRVRLNYQSPEAHMYLSNGSTSWVYEPEAKQAFRQELKSSQLPAALSFLMGKGKLTDEFEASEAKNLPYGSAGDHKLSLKPKKPQSTYKAIYFVVDPDSFLVKESVLINAQGDINAFAFSAPQVNSKIADDVFKWSPPPGVRVVEGAKAAR